MAIGYWGYPNGDIPNAAMTPITSRGSTYYLKPDAAYWWLRLQAAYASAWSVALSITDGYRNLAEQWYYWNAYQAGWGNVAAYPGKSNHGWAMAVDIYTPAFGGSTGTPQHNWLRANAPSYGWTWTTGQASGESWHWEFTNVPTQPVDTGDSTPITNTEEDENMLYYKDNDTDIIYARDLASGFPSLTIIGKNLSNSGIGFLGAPIGAKISPTTGVNVQKLVDWYGTNPVPAPLYDELIKNKPPVKGLKK